MHRSKHKIILIRNAQAYDFGGGERFPVFAAEILKKLGNETHVISRNPKLLEYAKEKNVPTVRGWWWSNQQWSGMRTLLFPVYAIWQVVLYFWYRKLFRSLGPDAVHIQSKDDFIAATYAAKASGARVIWTDHADLKHVWNNLNVPCKNPIGKWIYRAAKKADAITVVSRSEFHEVTKHLPQKTPITSKIQVVYNGTSDVYSRYRSTPINDVLTFCVVNRLVTDKGISEAIEAFSLLQKQYLDSQLILIGNGPEEEKFKHQANGIKNITFVGYQSDPLSFVAKSHVVLQPTYHEGFSVALVEASMMQKPIIATAVGGNIEIIENDKTGLLIPPKDANALYDAMKRLSEDVSLREKLGKAARKQYQEKFDFDTIVRTEFIPLYNGKKS